MNLTQQNISDINEKCPSDQGVFKEPYGIPVSIKEPVVYMRYETGGMSGGNCWEGSPQSYIIADRPSFEALDNVLAVLKPNISYLQYKKIDKLIQTNHDESFEYYGNSTDYEIKFIILSELENFLKTI